MPTLTFPNAISTFGMGNGASSVYATAHAGNTPALNNFNNTSGVGIKNQYDGSNYNFFRFWFHFSLSGIPSNATIVSAFLRLPGTNTSNNNTNTDTIGIYQSTVVSNTVLATGDWNNWGATLFSSIAIASWNQAGNNDFALNASGIAYLQSVLGGYAKLETMTTQDHAATVPTGNNNSTFSTTGLILSVTYKIPGGLLSSSDI